MHFSDDRSALAKNTEPVEALGEEEGNPQNCRGNPARSRRGKLPQPLAEQLAPKRRAAKESTKVGIPVDAPAPAPVLQGAASLAGQAIKARTSPKASLLSRSARANYRARAGPDSSPDAPGLQADTRRPHGHEAPSLPVDAGGQARGDQGQVPVLGCVNCKSASLSKHGLLRRLLQIENSDGEFLSFRAQRKK